MACKSYKSYMRYFRKDYEFLASIGETEEEIEEFFATVAHDGIRNDINYAKHNLPMFGKKKNEDASDTGQFYHRSGGDSKKRNKSDRVETKDEGRDNETSEELELAGDEERDLTGWSSIRVSATSLSTEDNTDVFIEEISIFEQLGDEDLLHEVYSLSAQQQEILEMLVRNFKQKDIAKYFGISEAAVSKHVRAIRKKMEPYYRERRWIKITEDTLDNG